MLISSWERDKESGDEREWEIEKEREEKRENEQGLEERKKRKKDFSSSRTMPHRK